MPAFIELQCTRCRARHGFYGQLVDMPPCPKCGYRPPTADLLPDQKEIDTFKNFLKANPRKTPTTDKDHTPPKDPP